MRVNLFTRSRLVEGHKNAPGSVLQDYILLQGDPTDARGAATKGYVDQLFSQLNADGITQGALGDSQMPVVSGDLVSSPGTSVWNMTPVTGAQMGAYPTVDEKGRVVAMGKVPSSHIPDIPWTKVAGELPGSVVVYGIGDALQTTGGVLNVNLTLHGAPTHEQHAATRLYTEQVAAGITGGSLAVGDIVLKPTQVSVTGFLRCNGAMANKTTYADLYAVISNLYGPGDATNFILPDMESLAPPGMSYYIKH